MIVRLGSFMSLNDAAAVCKIPRRIPRLEVEGGYRNAARAVTLASTGVDCHERLVGGGSRQDFLDRAHALAEQVDRPEYQVQLISGPLAFHVGRAEHRQALRLGKQLEQIGTGRNDVPTQLGGSLTWGSRIFFWGSSSPPAPSWNGIWTLVIQPVAPAGYCPIRRCSPTSR